MSDAVGLSGPAVEALLAEEGAMAASVGDAILLSRQATPREAAHESIHFMQNRRGPSPTGVSQPQDRSEDEAELLIDRVLQGQPTRVQQDPSAALQRQTRPAQPSIADQVRALVNYTVTDLRVGPEDEAEIVRILSGASGLAGVVTDLDSDGTLERMISRVDSDNGRHELLQLLGQLSGTSLQQVEQRVVPLGSEWVTQLRLARNGVTYGAPAFNASSHSNLISSHPSDPFTGAGATGVNPTSLDIPLLDQGLMASGHQWTIDEYSNPIDTPNGLDLDIYLQGLTMQERQAQAQLLCNQPISTVEPESYGGELPSRAQIMRAAASAHNLHPELIAAFILAEQRDQSQREDAKDFLAADSRIMEANTSIGLGQVVVSTAQNHDLFADLLDANTRQDLSHRETARLLASDEYNIFAAARYIRKVADDGSQIAISSLPHTQSEYPNIDMAAYANNSRSWPEDNIHALGSEYTSRAWDDSLSTGWGWFVHEAYRDVLSAGVF